MNKVRLPEFKVLFDDFKLSEDYTFRSNQSVFASVAKKIIAATLKNEPFENKYLTGFIQLFKVDTSDDNFDKYLATNINDKKEHDQLKEEAYTLGYNGYTAAGKASVNNLSAEQLSSIKKFLSEAFAINNIEQATKLTDEFDNLNIPEIKSGIYSPWLHYINPEIFPIINNSHNSFLDWLGVKRKYSACIEAFNELREVTGEPHLAMIDYYTYQFDKESFSEPSNKLVEKTIIMTSYSKNIILFGPPGTGKTYNSIDKAVEIATGKKNIHSENKKVFDELRKEGQIEFVTFHQNYSYEDFIVGLKPDAEFEQLRFKPYKGIFYEIAKRARENYFASKERRSKELDFDSAFNEIVKPISEGREVEIKMKSNISFWIYDLTATSILFRKSKGSTIHTLSIDSLKELVEGTRATPAGLASYYTPLVNLVQEKKKEGNDLGVELRKNYVLIIDEINRANISRVFGELITLLEDDKRIDEPNELRISLLNGEKDFAIPPNLYVIGTMNTADKSIALVDIALRRRFEFIGYYPNYELKELESEKVNLLQCINKMIYSKKKSADFLIGHAYFLTKTSIENVLQNKVVPLLMEYFSGKTDIVSEIFFDSGWNVRYSGETYSWNITKAP